MTTTPAVLTLRQTLANEPTILARVEALLETAHAEPLDGVTVRRLDEDGQSFPLAHALPAAPPAFAVYVQVERALGRAYPREGPYTEDRWLADFDGDDCFDRAVRLAHRLAALLAVPVTPDIR